ncbi:MAG: PQQ-dependent sugar dehydrogenase [Planctomycetota bacterium]|nr:PQQ-dependent sugar dehydrogenase [Planctomycetota bacterium]
MASPCLRLLGGALALLASWAPNSLAQDDEGLPPGFVAETVLGGWNQPIDLAFLPDGRLLVAEKAGLVWMVDAGVKSTAPVLDLSEEVGDAGSRGLKSLVVDPDFANNGLVYLFYDVDRHHLFFFGTVQYDPLVSDNTGASVARISRFALNPSDNFTSMVPGSRTVLVGETASTGIPLIGGHQSGMLCFGDDGSLLASCGDGAPAEFDIGGGAANAAAIAEGILTPDQDVGAFRAQQVNSLNGKVLRLNPANGDGLANNPHFDPLAPRAARSRMWARGLRNPFRIEVVPGSATASQQPGAILIGDVGHTKWEEINRATEGGMNFGWPLYEGMGPLPDFKSLTTPNPAAPNPLFGVGTCTQAFFTFQELLAPSSQVPVIWRNPCDLSQQVPASAYPSVHTRPDIDWNHVGPARAKAFDAFGNPTSFVVDDPLSPIKGESFKGSCAMGGVWYSTGNYPDTFNRSYLFSDYADSWIKNLGFDPAGQPRKIGKVAEAIGKVVAMETDPISGDVYYLQLSVLPMLPGVLVHLAYYPGNVPPMAAVERAPIFGPSPLTVQFDGSESSDPEGLPLSFAWDFGDGTPLSRLESPIHIFPSADRTLQGTIAAHVLELVPPQVIDLTPGLSPSVIADGYFINPSAPLTSEQYVTIYQGTDTDPEEWVGYRFSQPQTLHQVIFQEGSEIGADGGWFDTLTVDVLVGGVWTEVTGLVVQPPYPGQNGVFYETFELTFQRMLCDGVRIRGLAGGTQGYVSVGELRAIAQPALTGAPTRHDVVLTVEDSVSLTSQASTSVWTDNTPPNVHITGPLNGGTYDPTKHELVPLTATTNDAESPTSSLTCSWQVSLHHNDHAHPEPEIVDCLSSITLAPHGISSEHHYWEFTLTATDPEGLASSVTSALYTAPPSLLTSDYSVSLLHGGSTDLSLDAGTSRAGDLYVMLISGSGIFPGVDLGSVSIPLNLDLWFLVTAGSPSLTIFQGFTGLLDVNGTAVVPLTIPAGVFLGLEGANLNFAYVTSAGTGTVDFASNPVPLQLVY